MSEQTKNYELTVMQLKTYNGFENMSEDEAKEICLQLKELSLIFYNCFQKTLNSNSLNVKKYGKKK